MIYYAVIDTNVIVSAMLNPNSIPGLVIKYVLAGKIKIFLNAEILDEYTKVINRDKFGFDKEDINHILSKIKELGEFLERTNTLESFIDQTDVVFYEITLTGISMVETYLVTGNSKHFPSKPFVVTPKEMIDIIESN